MALKTKTFTQTIFLDAAPEEVYDAFMNSKKHSEITQDKAVISPKVGGKFTAFSGYAFGKNLKLIRGKKILQEWQTTEWPRGYPPSRFELKLKKNDNGTEVTMIHSKVPAEQANDYKIGWIDFYWTPMKKYFEKK